jgi:hypothetical protein
VFETLKKHRRGVFRAVPVPPTSWTSSTSCTASGRRSGAARAMAYARFAPLTRSPWVLEAILYRDVAEVRASLERIIAPARELRSATSGRLFGPAEPRIDPLMEAP